MKTNLVLRNIFVLLIALASADRLIAQAPTPFDLVITNGHIIDGTGSPWYSGDVGIRDGRVAAIGNLAAAPRKRTIDADGKVVAPGFIDMLGQSELSILVEPRLPPNLYVTITTEIAGNGCPRAPGNDAIPQATRPASGNQTPAPRRRTFPQDGMFVTPCLPDRRAGLMPSFLGAPEPPSPVI